LTLTVTLPVLGTPCSDSFQASSLCSERRAGADSGTPVNDPSTAMPVDSRL
jgi:hypothetical protein